MTDDPLPYGYEPHHVATLARRAARLPRFWALIDRDERADIASLAIIERLYLGDTEPDDRELYRIAEHAIERAADRVAQGAGIARYGGRTGRGFAVYWRADRCSTSFEERLLESIALYQVFPRLTPAHREALSAVARHWGNRTAAANELGISRMALMVRVSRARAEFRWWWFWPESPPKLWGRDHGMVTTHDQSRENRAIAALKHKRKRATA